MKRFAIEILAIGLSYVRQQQTLPIVFEKEWVWHLKLKILGKKTTVEGANKFSYILTAVNSPYTNNSLSQYIHHHIATQN